ncbi:MAG: T9SS type A sorting domain-containing protein [Sporocytophaga sp.]|nr:T9SS type A sorting domain-containing protein [Sporocytophaga sp.]
MHRSYKLTGSTYNTANLGRSVAINGHFLAATATGYMPIQGTRPSVFIAGKTNGVWNNSFTYTINDPDIVISSELQVALDGYGTLAIGSPDATINGLAFGSVFIYEFNGSQWVRKQRLTPTVQSVGGKFGKSIAFHNNRLIVGAPFSNGGRAYIYTKNGGSWSNSSIFPSLINTYPGSKLGDKVDISDNTAIISAPGHNGTGSVFILDLQGNSSPYQISNLKASSVAIENVQAIIGVDHNEFPGNASAVRFYLKEWNGWNLKKTRSSTEAGDNFGYDVDIEGSKVILSRKYADKGSILNVGAAVLYDYWTTINSSSREAGDFDEAVEVNNLYPNPSTLSEVTFNSNEEILNVNAYSQDGSLTQLSFSGNKIDVKSLTPGLYTIQIRTAKGVEIKKLSVL